MSDHLRLEPAVRMVVDRLAAANLPPFEAGTAVRARELSRLIRPARVPKPVAQVTDFKVPNPSGDVLVRRYADTVSPRAAILFLHGGGWTLGSVDESDIVTRELALTTDCEIYSVDYRLAPEAPHPAAIEDGEAALDWLARRTTLPIIIMGDSAGANLATVIARRERDRGDHRIRLQILAYPVTDSRMEGKSYVLFAEGPLLTAPLMAWFWDQYAPDAKTRQHPDLSPSRADLAGLPPAFVLTAENDVLRDEGREYAAALTAAGVTVEQRVYAGQIHGFLGMVGISDGTRQAYHDIAAAIVAAT